MARPLAPRFCAAMFMTISLLDPLAQAAAEKKRPDAATPPFTSAWARRIPTRIGMCVQTRIETLGSRGEGAPDSGSAILYANGVYGVSYEVIEAVRASRVGDPITLCLVSVPRNCPKDDARGKEYSALNRRTKQQWTLADSQHYCGGA